MTTSHKKAGLNRPGSQLLQTGLKKSSKKGLAEVTKAAHQQPAVDPLPARRSIDLAIVRRFDPQEPDTQ